MRAPPTLCCDYLPHSVTNCLEPTLLQRCNGKFPALTAPTPRAWTSGAARRSRVLANIAFARQRAAGCRAIAHRVLVFQARELGAKSPGLVARAPSYSSVKRMRSLIHVFMGDILNPFEARILILVGMVIIGVAQAQQPTNQPSPATLPPATTAPPAASATTETPAAAMPSAPSAVVLKQAKLAGYRLKAGLGPPCSARTRPTWKSI